MIKVAKPNEGEKWNVLISKFEKSTIVVVVLDFSRGKSPDWRKWKFGCNWLGEKKILAGTRFVSRI